MGKKQTFLMKDNNSEKYHLNIVISDIDSNGKHLIVPVNTFHKNSLDYEQGKSYILYKNDHPFITHKSWIKLSYAKSVPYIKIYNGIHVSGELIEKPDITEEILYGIQEYARYSGFLNRKFIYFFDYF
jgi:hypothetical protein